MGTPLLSVQMQLEEMKRKKSKKMRRVSSNLHLALQSGLPMVFFCMSLAPRSEHM